MKFKTVIVFAIAALGFYAGIYFAPVFNSSAISEQTSEQVYTCPMHAHINEKHSGSCPICGMDLVIKQIASTDSQEKYKGVAIDPTIKNNLGIKTAQVKRSTLYRPIHTYGYINKVDTVTSQIISAATDAVVVKLSEKKVGDEVAANEFLIELKSAAWKQMQEDLLSAINKNDMGKIRVANDTLMEKGFDFADIQRLKSAKNPTDKIIINASKNGIITQLNINNKQQVSAGEALLILDPKYPITTFGEVFEGQWKWLKVGQKATMNIRSVPGIEWEGIVQTVDDLVSSRSRTLKIQVAFKAAGDDELKPGMQSNITVLASPHENVLNVPYDAVIRTGIESRVIVVLDDGRFRPVVVKTGISNEKSVEIISGLNETDRIVVSGQFLLDSESNLFSELSRMSVDDHSPTTKDH